MTRSRTTVRPTVPRTARTRGLAALAAGLLMAPLLAIAPARAGSDARLFLDSTVAVDEVDGTITLPLHEGRHHGARVWYVVTESSDGNDAARRGRHR